MIFTSTAQTFADVATSMNLKDHPYSQRIATTKIAHYLPQISSYEDALAVVAKQRSFRSARRNIRSMIGISHQLNQRE